MELSNKSQEAHTKYAGRDTVTLSAGQTLKIETSPNGEEILNEIVPEGKTWVVDIDLKVTET